MNPLPHAPVVVHLMLVQLMIGRHTGQHSPGGVIITCSCSHAIGGHLTDSHFSTHVGQHAPGLITGLCPSGHLTCLQVSLELQGGSIHQLVQKFYCYYTFKFQFKILQMSR
jgi:hypothetical protein